MTNLDPHIQAARIFDLVVDLDSTEPIYVNVIVWEPIATHIIRSTLCKLTKNEISDMSAMMGFSRIDPSKHKTLDMVDILLNMVGADAELFDTVY